MLNHTNRFLFAAIVAAFFVIGMAFGAIITQDSPGFDFRPNPDINSNSKKAAVIPTGDSAERIALGGKITAVKDGELQFVPLPDLGIRAARVGADTEIFIQVPKSAEELAAATSADQFIDGGGQVFRLEKADASRLAAGMNFRGEAVFDPADKILTATRVIIVPEEESAPADDSKSPTEENS
jgi:hypothetical protein